MEISKFFLFLEKSGKILNDYKSKDTENFYFKMNRKCHINLSFIGNLNSGKSTIIWHLLYITGYLSQKHYELAIMKSNKIWKSSKKYAMLIEKDKEERTNTKLIHLIN